MPTRTRTELTHWETQNRRRRAFIEDWRHNRRTVIRRAGVVMRDTARRMQRGVYMGADGDNPTRLLDATLHQIAPGTVSTVHRHSWDAIMMATEGSGWTEIDGQRFEWSAWDGLHLPAWAWHRHGNDGQEAASFLTYSSEPLLESLNLAVLEDGGDTPAAELPSRPQAAAPPEGDDAYARRLRRLAQLDEDRRGARLHLDYDEIPLRTTPKGTRTKFLNDAAIGSVTSGLTQVMIQFAPGLGQSMHRHPGEAWLYIVEGRGHSYLGTEPTGGTNHEWEAGDLVVVDHFLWHQHFNDDPDRPARMVRIHMFASILETMRAVTDPQSLFDEKLETAPNVAEVDWPDDIRPA